MHLRFVEQRWRCRIQQAWSGKVKMNGAESDAEKVRFRLVRRGSCQSGTCHPFCVCVCVFEECRELKGVSVWLWWFCFVFRVLRRGEKESSKWYCNHFQELVEKEKEEGHEHDMIWGIVGGFWIRICVMPFTRHHLSQRFTFHFKPE